MYEIFVQRIKGAAVPFMLVVMVAMSLAACNGFEEKSYKSIKSAAIAYDAAMQIAAEYYKSIDDTDEQAEFWENVETVAKPVRASIVTAKTACMAYSKALAAYTSAKAVADEKEDSGEELTEDEENTLSTLTAELTAAKAAATAALNAVDADSLADAIQTIIDLF